MTKNMAIKNSEMTSSDNSTDKGARLLYFIFGALLLVASVVGYFDYISKHH